MNLPDDIKIQIYTFLHMDDVKKIEKKKDNYLTLIKLENKTKLNLCENIYRNIILNQCFRCENELESNYVMGICSECNFTIDNKRTYPLFCRNCIKLKSERGFLTRYCLTCPSYSAFLGIVAHLS